MVEMTGQYEFMLPLLMSCLSAYGIAEAFRAPAIYEALLVIVTAHNRTRRPPNVPYR